MAKSHVARRNPLQAEKNEAGAVKTVDNCFNFKNDLVALEVWAGQLSKRSQGSFSMLRYDLPGFVPNH